MQEIPKRELKAGSEEPLKGSEKPKTNTCDKSQSETEKDKKDNTNKMSQKDSKAQLGETASNKTKSDVKVKENKKEERVSGKPPPK